MFMQLCKKKKEGESMENQKRKKVEYNIKYQKENMEQINLRVFRDEKSALQEEAENKGLSMRQYMIDAINEKAGRIIISTRESRKKEREEKE